MKRDPAKNRAWILIVDDHPAVREALAMRISRQPDLEVCGEAADSSEALCLVADTEPDVAVVDISFKTIETYRDRIRAKLNLNDGTALAHYATNWMQENG